MKIIARKSRRKKSDADNRIYESFSYLEMKKSIDLK
jgi:hypothetical protein